MSCVQLSEGGFPVVYPLGLWSRSSGVVKVLYAWIWLEKLFTFTFTFTSSSLPPTGRNLFTWQVLSSPLCESRIIDACYLSGWHICPISFLVWFVPGLRRARRKLLALCLEASRTPHRCVGLGRT